MNRRELGSIRQIQEIGFDEVAGWLPIQGPIDGFRLRQNLPYFRNVGFSTPTDLPEGTVASYGYTGAIRLNKQNLTYLYR